MAIKRANKVDLAAAVKAAGVRRRGLAGRALRTSRSSACTNTSGST